MSVQAMTWAIEQQFVTDPTARHVLLVLANYTSKAGKSAYPAVATLARETGLSERTVQLKLKHLLTVGAITLGNQEVAAVDHDGRPKPSRYRTNVYDLNMVNSVRGEGAAPQKGESDGVSGANLTAPAGANLAQTRGEGAAPDPKALDPRALKASKSLSVNHTAEVALTRTFEEGELEWPEEWDLEEETVESFRKHCEDLGKALTASAWAVTRRDLQDLWDKGVDLNESLRRTMQSRWVIPVDPSRGRQARIDRRQEAQQGQVDQDARWADRNLPPGAPDPKCSGAAAAERLQ